VKDLIKIKNRINNEIYYTSPSFKEKVIEGNKFIRVLRNPYDTSKLFMREDSIEFLTTPKN
jgi:hypothetical protein